MTFLDSPDRAHRSVHESRTPAEYANPIECHRSEHQGATFWVGVTVVAALFAGLALCNLLPGA